MPDDPRKDLLAYLDADDARAKAAAETMTATGERLMLHKVDGEGTGLLEFEPPEGPFAPGSWLRGRCWVDDDGRHVWFAHDCTDGRVATMLPWSTWQVLLNTGDVHPSLSCDGCGLHSTYRIEWAPYGREVVPGHDHASPVAAASPVADPASSLRLNAALRDIIGMDAICTEAFTPLYGAGYNAAVAAIQSLLADALTPGWRE